MIKKQIHVHRKWLIFLEMLFITRCAHKNRNMMLRMAGMQYWLFIFRTYGRNEYCVCSVTTVWRVLLRFRWPWKNELVRTVHEVIRWWKYALIGQIRMPVSDDINVPWINKCAIYNFLRSNETTDIYRMGEPSLISTYLIWNYTIFGDNRYRIYKERHKALFSLTWNVYAMSHEPDITYWFTRSYIKDCYKHIKW